MRNLLFTSICFLLLLPLVAEAQVLSQQGRFSVDYNQGCSPYEITITDIETATNKNISYWLFVNGNLEELTSKTFNFTYSGKVIIVQWFEDRMPLADSLVIWGHETLVPQFDAYACSNLGAVAEIVKPTYDYYQVTFDANPPITVDAATNWKAEDQFSDAGIKNIIIRGFYNNAPDNCAEASTLLEARPTLPTPEWGGLQWDPQTSQLSIQFNLHPFIKYQLERLNPTTGNYELLFPLREGLSDTTFSQAGMADQYFCYRIKALDDCFANHVASETMCTAAWEVEAMNGHNEITYQTHNSFVGTAELLSESGKLVDAANTATGVFKEEDVICGQLYCYQLSLKPQSLNGVQAVSAATCIAGQNSLPLLPLKNISTYWLGNQLVIKSGLTSAGQNQTLSLMSAQGGRIISGEGDSLVYHTTPAPTCYLLSYSNSCNTAAADATDFCPLFLRNNSTEPDVFEPVWTFYTGYEAGVGSYALQEIDNANTVLKEWNTGSDNTYMGFSYFSAEDNGRRFRAVAYPAAAGIAPSYSNVFTFELIMKGYFPNAFSPNGDGANDDFKILGKFVEQASLRVYNRWGEELFNSIDKDKGWDGTYQGKLQPAGHYAYKAEVTTADGKRSVMSGTVFLKR